MKAVLRSAAASFVLVALGGCSGQSAESPAAPADTAADSGSSDTAAPDTFAPDTYVADTFAPDTYVADTFVADSSSNDSALADTSVADSSTLDTSTLDTSTLDTSTLDTFEASSAEVATDVSDAGCTVGPCVGETRRVSVSSSGAEANGPSSDLPTVSADGRIVAFTSGASNLVAGDTNGASDTFVRDVLTGVTTAISVNGSNATVGGGPGSVSPTGRYVAFSSLGAVGAGGSASTSQQVYLFDRDTGSYDIVSLSTGGVRGNSGSSPCFPSVSNDGSRVMFYSAASNFFGGDSVGTNDAFVRDRTASTTTRIGASIGGAFATDGVFAAFSSGDGSLVTGDTNSADDVFVMNIASGTYDRVSVSSAGEQANGGSAVPTITPDGRFVAFQSAATNLVAGDTNATSDIFVFDRASRAIERVTVGVAGAQANGPSENAKLSADGRYVLFISRASNLVSGDTNGVADAFVFDRVARTTERVSVGPGSVQGNDRVHYASLSADGKVAVFSSSASNLVSADENGVADVFIRVLR